MFRIKVLAPVIVLIGFYLLLPACNSQEKTPTVQTQNQNSGSNTYTNPNADINEASMAVNLNAGKQIYDNYCAACHGASGNGKGEYSDEMETRPTDFTTGMYKFKSTPYGTLPTKEDIVSTLELGVRTTAMIPQLQLSKNQMYEAAKYILSFAPKGEKIGTPITIPPKPELTDALITKGKKIFSLNCVSCHGSDLKGDGPNAGKLQNYKGQPVRPANLTLIPLKRANTPDWMYKIINNGIEGTPMTAYSGVIKPEDIWAVVFYIDSVKKEERPTNQHGGMMGGGMMGGMMGHRLVGEEYIGARIDMAAAHAWMMSR